MSEPVSLTDAAQALLSAWDRRWAAIDAASTKWGPKGTPGQEKAARELAVTTSRLDRAVEALRAALAAGPSGPSREQVRRALVDTLVPNRLVGFELDVLADTVMALLARPSDPPTEAAEVLWEGTGGLALYEALLGTQPRLKVPEGTRVRVVADAADSGEETTGGMAS